MGAAYAEGIEDVLKQKGFIVGQTVYFNSFQAADIEDNQESTVGTGVVTYSIDYQFEDDPVINNPVRSSPGFIKNVTMKIRTKSNEKDWSDRHAGPIWQGRRVWNDISTAIITQANIRMMIDNFLQQSPDIPVIVN